MPDNNSSKLAFARDLIGSRGPRGQRARWADHVYKELANEGRDLEWKTAATIVYTNLMKMKF